MTLNIGGGAFQKIAVTPILTIFCTDSENHSHFVHKLLVGSLARGGAGRGGGPVTPY